MSEEKFDVKVSRNSKPHSTSTRQSKKSVSKTLA